MMKKYLIYTAILMSLSFLSSCKHDDSSQPYIKVFKYDGSVQCESTGIELDVMALEIINAGVDVVCSQKGHDGLFRAAVCGADTGYINIYKIHFSNLSDAQNLGFKSVGELSEYQDEKCE